MSKKQIAVKDCYLKIKNILDEARGKVYQQVNFVMVRAYWDIGCVIMEEE